MGEGLATSLADPALRRALTAMARRRVPPHEVDEIVQATLTEALASVTRPLDDDMLRRWVHGIARHKIADFHRRARREELGFDDDEAGVAHDGTASEAASHDAVDLLRWAEREAPPQPEATRTLGWMLREGAGEKLESIARDEALPAPQVRQRVARLRRHFRARWAAQLAAVALLLALVALTAWYLRRRVPMVRPGTTTEMIDPVARGIEILAESRAAAESATPSPAPPPLAPQPIAPPPPAPTTKHPPAPTVKAFPGAKPNPK